MTTLRARAEPGSAIRARDLVLTVSVRERGGECPSRRDAVGVVAASGLLADRSGGWVTSQGARDGTRRDVGCEHLAGPRVGQARRGPASLSIATVADEAVPILPQTASDVMTLNGGGSAAGGSRGGCRERERRRGSTPWGPAPPLHRRSMPVDERDLQAALAPSALATAGPGPRTQGPRLDWPESSSDSLSSGGSDSDESVYKVLLLGAPGVGKSALARIFGGLEDGPEAEAAGEGLGLFKGGEIPGLGLGATGLGTWNKMANTKGSEGPFRIRSLPTHFTVGEIKGEGTLGRRRNAEWKARGAHMSTLGWGRTALPARWTGTQPEGASRRGALGDGGPQRM